MTNNKYNAHTEPLFKELDMLKVGDIFDVQCKMLTKICEQVISWIFWHAVYIQ